MTCISSLKINDFRNLNTVELTPCRQGLNIIHGQNGSGKTSLLEAIHYMGLGRSFRSGTSSRLIRHEAEKFILFAQISSDSEREMPIGVEREKNGSTRLRVAENDTTGIAEIASILPIRVINSHAHNLFESGPAYRRKYLDWGLFYQAENFFPIWRQFERILKQRNTLLRDRRPKREIDGWTAELVKYGLELHQMRCDYVRFLTPCLNELAKELLPIDELQIAYRPGWDESEEYAAILADSHHEESRFGCTQYGPHRADLDVQIEGVPAKYFLSRGQQKLLVCAMLLAQGMHMSTQGKKRVIYLVDDLPAELDKRGREKLMSLLARQNSQVFITAIEKEAICDFINAELDVKTKLFHVEHGKLTETKE